MTNAVEKAQDKLKEATSGDEDAFLLAELIHNLGIQKKAAEYTALANGQSLDEDYAPKKTIAEHIAECDERTAELWNQADKDGIRRAVEDALPEIQANWRKRAAEPPSQNGR